MDQNFRKKIKRNKGKSNKEKVTEKMQSKLKYLDS